MFWSFWLVWVLLFSVSTHFLLLLGADESQSKAKCQIQSAKRKTPTWGNSSHKASRTSLAIVQCHFLRRLSKSPKKFTKVTHFSIAEWHNKETMLGRLQQGLFFRQVGTHLRVDATTVPVSQTEECSYHQRLLFSLRDHQAHLHSSGTYSAAVCSLSLVLTGCGSRRVSSPARVWMFECGGKQRCFTVYLFSKARGEVGPLGTGNPPPFFFPSSFNSLSLLFLADKNWDKGGIKGQRVCDKDNQRRVVSYSFYEQHVPGSNVKWRRFEVKQLK